jgi:hypothetical protein
MVARWWAGGTILAACIRTLHLLAPTRAHGHQRLAQPSNFPEKKHPDARGLCQRPPQALYAAVQAKWGLFVYWEHRRCVRKYVFATGCDDAETASLEPSPCPRSANFTKIAQSQPAGRPAPFSLPLGNRGRGSGQPVLFPEKRKAVLLFLFLFCLFVFLLGCRLTCRATCVVFGFTGFEALSTVPRSLPSQGPRGSVL